MKRPPDNNWGKPNAKREYGTMAAGLRTAAAAGVLLLSLAHDGAAGGADDFTPIDAEALIEACWALTKEDRHSGVTARMHEGTAITAGCLEEVIADQAAQMFDPGDPVVDQLDTWIAELRNGYGKFYWALNNQHKMCLLW